MPVVERRIEPNFRLRTAIADRADPRVLVCVWDAAIIFQVEDLCPGINEPMSFCQDQIFGFPPFCTETEDEVPKVSIAKPLLVGLLASLLGQIGFILSSRMRQRVEF